MPTVTVRLRPKTASALAARAAREGRSLDGLLADLADAAVISRPDEPDSLSDLLAEAPLLPPDALSRDAIYGDG